MRNRIKEIRLSKKPRLTLEKLALLTGYSRAQVARDEKSDDLSMEKIRVYAQRLDISEETILGLDSSQSEIVPSDTVQMDKPIPVTFPTDMVPILGHAEGSDDAINFNDGEPIGHAQRHPAQVGAKDAFALYVRGSSMVNRYEEGDLVYFIKGRSPRAGQDCVVELVSGQGYLKRFEKRTDKEVICKQFNPAKRWVKKLSEVKALHAVVGTKSA